jgi:hypothetical protein
MVDKNVALCTKTEVLSKTIWGRLIVTSVIFRASDSLFAVLYGNAAASRCLVTLQMMLKRLLLELRAIVWFEMALLAGLLRLRNCFPARVSYRLLAFIDFFMLCSLELLPTTSTLRASK